MEPPRLAVSPVLRDPRLHDMNANATTMTITIPSAKSTFRMRSPHSKYSACKKAPSKSEAPDAFDYTLLFRYFNGAKKGASIPKNRQREIISAQ
jgi:hypothetical protein